MRFSEAWLRELVNPPLTTNELNQQLTMAGLEVDSVEPAAADFSGIVVGEVLTVDSHPNADKLRVCTVAVGESEALQIVCGASNVRAGLRVPTALVGAVLPGDFKIKKSKLRGEISLGMLCSEQELGLAGDADGLMELPADAPVGCDIREYLALNDTIFEVDLTPNRADCLSVEGIAREVAVLNKIDWATPEVAQNAISHEQMLSVSVEAKDACPRYLGRLIKGVNPAAETPLWMQERLRRSGLRSLGPLVDVTNYVLLELGQPLHAFDAHKITGSITVRMGKADEELSLLNDQTIQLDNDVLVIADAERALALAGVMGGSETAVTNDTQDVFLECAYFAPQIMMGKARSLGLHTDSSHRFERGVDPFLQHRAIERATQLITDIAGGSAGPITEAVAETCLPERNPVVLRKNRIKRILGVVIDDAEVQQIFQRLGMTVEVGEKGWTIIPPGFRFDIAIEADLIEELGRLYGYNNLPQSNLLMQAELGQATESRLELDRVKDLLVDRGYQEAITYSFVDQEMQLTVVPEDEFISLKNPISSDLAVMRTTLWCGLLQAALRNINRQHSRIRLFESGLRFLRRQNGLSQDKMLAGLVLGNVYNEQWGLDNKLVDFFDVKADVEALLALSGCKVKFIPANHPALHPGQTAKIITAGGEMLGWLGMLHPTLEKQLGFHERVFLFELAQDVLLNKQIPKFEDLSKFPSVRRDFALVVNESVSAQDIIECIEDCRETNIQDILIFDVYRGKGIADDCKSIALGLVIQDYTKTLTDTEIDAIVNKVLDNLFKQINAKLRD
jgi:phenylalanyl-tRNA synthetase beta chain